MNSKLVQHDFEDFSMFLIKDDRGISRTLSKPDGHKNREIEFVSLLKSSLVSGDICCDIGANIGFITLVMSQCIGASGRIYAFEPDELNYSVLQQNIELNKLAEVVSTKRLALSDTKGEVKFFLSDQSNLHSMSANKKTANNMVRVPSDTIDNLFKDVIELPTCYKMDVEGAEALILMGMEKTIERSIPGTRIFIEVHPQYYNSELNMEKALRFVISKGMTVQYVISAGLAQPKLFRDKGYVPFKTYKSSGWTRGLYILVDDEDAIEFSTKPHREYVPERKKETSKIVRYLVLEKMA